MLGIVTKLIPPQYRILAAVVGLAALFAAGVGLGHEWRDRDARATISALQKQYAEAALESMNRANEIRDMQAKIGQTAAELFEANQALEKARAKTVTKEVIRYVQEPYAGQCALPVGWVRIDTASAAGVPPDSVAAGVADGAPSGFTDADAIQVIADRNLICRSEIEKLRSLQFWACGITGGSDSECQRYTGTSE